MTSSNLAGQWTKFWAQLHSAGGGTLTNVLSFIALIVVLVAIVKIVIRRGKGEGFKGWIWIGLIAAICFAPGPVIGTILKIVDVVVNFFIKLFGIV